MVTPCMTCSALNPQLPMSCRTRSAARDISIRCRPCSWSSISRSPIRCRTGFYRLKMPRLRTMQRRLFGEPPARETDARAAAREVARSLARKAYRRPPSQAELDVLLEVFDLGRQNNLAYPDVPAIDAQGDPGFTAVPVYYAGRRSSNPMRRSFPSMTISSHHVCPICYGQPCPTMS